MTLIIRAGDSIRNNIVNGIRYRTVSEQGRFPLKLTGKLRTGLYIAVW